MNTDIVFTVFQDLVFFILVIGIGYLFGKAFYKIYLGEPVFTKKASHSLEGFLFLLMGVDPEEKMTIKTYIKSILLFSLVGFVFLFGLLMLQGYLFLNPNNVKGMSFQLAFNTAISYITNTDWQSYSGETQASYLTDTLGFTVANFLSGAVGISVLFALLRGFASNEARNLGNFWADIVRITIFMIPVCFFGSFFLVLDGVPQTYQANISYVSLEGTDSTLYLGPVASQEMIKQLFTNGGGFYNTNSAFPFENPTPFTDLLENLSILIIPVGLCFTFGKAVKDSRQGMAILSAMSVLFIACLIVCTCFEYKGTELPDYILACGNIEGKETRFGIGLSSLWAISTTAASNGSVNSMLDSFTPLGGLWPLFLMLLGEIVYGGAGSGLYGMVAFAILTVFIAGLMVGRTPEYLKKKIGSFEMKMVCLIILPPVLCVLLGTAATVLYPSSSSFITNKGAHGFTEILYAFASFANNNGSAFSGLHSDNSWIDMTGGLIMLITRFVPMIATISLGYSLSAKKVIAQSSGTLSTSNAMFVFLLVSVILIIGALSFFPALSLGPIADYVG